MPIEIISKSIGNNTDWTHSTPSGLVNSALVVGVGTHQGVISGITYNGDAMTQIALGSSAFDEDGSVWILLNPDAGDNTIDITRSGGSWHGAAAVTLQGVKQTTTITNNNATGTSAAGSVTVVPPNTNTFIFAAMGAEAIVTTLSPLNAYAETLQGQTFEAAGILWYFSKTGLPQTPLFNIASGQRWGMAVMCLVEPDSVAIQTELTKDRHIEVGGGMSRTDSAR